MKKVTFILTLLMVTVISNLSAQTKADAITEIPSLKLTDGKNTVRMPDGKGSIQFVKRGDNFSDVVFIDEHGHNLRLTTTPASTNNKGTSTCKYPIPNGCFGMPNSQESGLCICKPADLTNGEPNAVYAMYIKRAKLYCRKAGGTQQEY